MPYATVANAAGKKRRAAVSDVDDEIQLDEDGNPIQKGKIKRKESVKLVLIKQLNFKSLH